MIGEVYVRNFKNRIHVVNYDKILSLQEEKITLLIDEKKIILFGSKFSLNQMCDDELLIEGTLNKVEIEQ